MCTNFNVTLKQALILKANVKPEGYAYVKVATKLGEDDWAEFFIYCTDTKNESVLKFASSITETRATIHNFSANVTKSQLFKGKVQFIVEDPIFDEIKTKEPEPDEWDLINSTQPSTQEPLWDNSDPFTDCNEEGEDLNKITESVEHYLQGITGAVKQLLDSGSYISIRNVDNLCRRALTNFCQRCVNTDTNAIIGGLVSGKKVAFTHKRKFFGITGTFDLAGGTAKAFLVKKPDVFDDEPITFKFDGTIPDNGRGRF